LENFNIISRRNFLQVGTETVVQMKDSAQLCAAIRDFAVDNKRVRQMLQDLRTEMIKLEAVLFAITETMTSISPAAQDTGLKLQYKTAHMVM
jgi:hypothetical protein